MNIRAALRQTGAPQAWEKPPNFLRKPVQTGTFPNFEFRKKLRQAGKVITAISNWPKQIRKLVFAVSHSLLRGLYLRESFKRRRRGWG